MYVWGRWLLLVHKTSWIGVGFKVVVIHGRRSPTCPKLPGRFPSTLANPEVAVELAVGSKIALCSGSLFAFAAVQRCRGRQGVGRTLIGQP